MTSLRTRSTRPENALRALIAQAETNRAYSHADHIMHTSRMAWDQFFHFLMNQLILTNM